MAAWRFAAKPRVDGEGDVLKKEFPTGSEGGRKGQKDDFEHPNMLFSGPGNGNDTKADGLFVPEGQGIKQPPELGLAV